MSHSLIDLDADAKRDFGRAVVLGTHELASSNLFLDATLIDLLDNFPRERIYAFTMGRDPERIDEFQKARHDGVSGKEMLEAVRSGRLWLNITRVDLADARYRKLITELYAELGSTVPGFEPLSSRGTLLISSPGAQVYFHADGPSSVLWHLRGHKRVWVYPALDQQYLTRELLEDIFAGVRHEFVPFKASFDAGAALYDLAPGQWICWPQNAPHRVVNGDSLNVSLSTEHSTASSERRYQVYMANRFFRTRLGRRRPSVREEGGMAVMKSLVQRSARRIGLNPLTYQSHPATVRIDAAAFNGVVALTSPTAGTTDHHG